MKKKKIYIYKNLKAVYSEILRDILNSLLSIFIKKQLCTAFSYSFSQQALSA